MVFWDRSITQNSPHAVSYIMDLNDRERFVRAVFPDGVKYTGFWDEGRKSITWNDGDTWRRISASEPSHAHVHVPQGKHVDYKARIVAFYQSRNPENVWQVDKLLKKWKGKEAKLLVALQNKYDAQNEYDCL